MLTPDAADVLIVSSRPGGGFFRGWRLVLLGLSILLGAFIAEPDALPEPWGHLVPQALLLGITVVILRGALLQRRTARLMLEVFEAVQLQHWPEASTGLQQLLSRPVRHPHARAELLLSLASVAESQHCFEAAQHVYESVLNEESADPLQLHTARVALAATLLRTGQITDAVSLVDKLSRAELPPPLRAQVELVSLFREVVMGQAQDNVEQADSRRQLFREHLSTRAGYGYGLLAAACDRAGRVEEARRYWHDATLLIRPSELLARFGELQPVASRYPAAEHAL